MSCKVTGVVVCRCIQVIPNADGNGSVPTVIVQFQGDADEATGAYVHV